MTTDLRYPIGRWQSAGALSLPERESAIADIEQLPAQLRSAVAGLSESQLDYPYRPGGWSVRQLVHHVPDSHLNSYTRLKLALTEDVPTIRPYDEARWAELPDSTGAIGVSLDLTDALHRRWTFLWRLLESEQWSRRFRHPEMGEMRLDELLALYSWHGRHHVAHITALRKREGW